MFSSSGDRLAQLQAFDETERGVKGLVDAGVFTIPSIFLNPNALPLSETRTTSITVPTIDFSLIEEDLEQREKTLKKVQDALETWGFFQVVNHGIPETLLEDMLKSTQYFFEQNNDVKKEYYSRDAKSKKFLYNSNFNLYNAKYSNWKDTFSCVIAPSPPNPEEMPPCLREILMEYSNQVMKLGKTLFEIISEILGLKTSHLDEIGSSEGLVMMGHYYPTCPQPELTMGTPTHADNDFLTVLLQDHIGGLQVLRDNQWFDVPPVPGALVINLVDYLQLVSNDKLKSVKHRVPAIPKGPRVSIASFFTTVNLPSTRVYGPIKELSYFPIQILRCIAKQHHKRFLRSTKRRTSVAPRSLSTTGCNMDMYL